jgi:DNA repair protein RecO (recombination protein O)
MSGAVMPMEKAEGLIVRTVDYSETSRIVTVWTKEFGKVRGLAKGGRRPKSAFEFALDLLTVCSMVLIRKPASSLDLLTEARAVERFPLLRKNLGALYAGYYVAELLGDLTQDYDPHPTLFEETVAALRDFGTQPQDVGSRLLRWETVLLEELGYAPLLDTCANCRVELAAEPDYLFRTASGGVVCRSCQNALRGGMRVSPAAWKVWQRLQGGAVEQVPPEACGELRQVYNHYISHLLGHRPRTMTYLGG